MGKDVGGWALWARTPAVGRHGEGPQCLGPTTLGPMGKDLGIRVPWGRTPAAGRHGQEPLRPGPKIWAPWGRTPESGPSFSGPHEEGRWHPRPHNSGTDGEGPRHPCPMGKNPGVQPPLPRASRGAEWWRARQGPALGVWGGGSPELIWGFPHFPFTPPDITPTHTLPCHPLAGAIREPRDINSGGCGPATPGSTAP